MTAARSRDCKAPANGLGWRSSSASSLRSTRKAAMAVIRHAPLRREPVWIDGGKDTSLVHPCASSECAAGVRVTRARLGWRDLARYSNRQRRTVSLGGFVGELEVEGDLEPFLPLLQMAEQVHVGKGATFGLGRIGWSLLAPAPDL